MAELFGSQMKRALLVICTLTAAAVLARAADRPQLKVYIVSKDPGKGLHAVSYPAFPKLGYISDKPDLAISHLVGVAYGSFPGLPKPDGGNEPPKEDRRSLQILLMPNDAAALNKITAEHTGARMLLMLDDDPLVAPEIKTPMVGQLMYISQVPMGLNTEQLKAKLEKLKSASPAASPTSTPQPSLTATPKASS
jgi:hypothetical protein